MELSHSGLLRLTIPPGGSFSWCGVSSLSAVYWAASILRPRGGIVGSGALRAC